MNRAFLPFLKSFSIVLLAMSSITYANESTTPTKADPVKGEALYVSGDAARGIVACVSCHGVAGNSTISVNPKLAGQHEAYIAKQLDNFKGPDRNNPVMTTFANMMTAEDMKNVSRYLSTQKAKPGAAISAAAALAPRAVRGRQTAGSAACRGRWTKVVSWRGR